jgi:hypothetical protein
MPSMGSKFHVITLCMLCRDVLGKQCTSYRKQLLVWGWVMCFYCLFHINGRGAYVWGLYRLAPPKNGWEEW